MNLPYAKKKNRTSGRSGTDGIFKRKEKRTGKIKRFFGNGPGAVSGETGTSVRGAFEADERSKKDRGKEKSGT